MTPVPTPISSTRSPGCGAAAARSCSSISTLRASWAACLATQRGPATSFQYRCIAALAAGSFAATRELAHRIGEVEFNALYHQGNGSHMFMNSVDDDTIMITVFGRRTTVGLVRFYSTAAAHNVANLLKTLQRNGHGLEFTAADISASPIFTDPAG